MSEEINTSAQSLQQPNTTDNTQPNTPGKPVNQHVSTNTQEPGNGKPQADIDRENAERAMAKMSKIEADNAEKERQLKAAQQELEKAKSQTEQYKRIVTNLEDIFREGKDEYEAFRRKAYAKGFELPSYDQAYAVQQQTGLTPTQQVQQPSTQPVYNQQPIQQQPVQSNLSGADWSDVVINRQIDAFRQENPDLDPANATEQDDYDNRARQFSAIVKMADSIADAMGDTNPASAKKYLDQALRAIHPEKAEQVAKNMAKSQQLAQANATSAGSTLQGSDAAAPSQDGIDALVSRLTPEQRERYSKTRYRTDAAKVRYLKSALGE